MKKPHLQLSEAERAGLQALVRQHKVGVKAHRRARAFLALDAGRTLKEAGQAAGGIDYNVVARWRDRCKKEGAFAALADRARSGRRPRIDGAQRATITALACSQPPEGHARWSLRLLAGKLVELGLVEAISHDHVGTILKKTRSSPTSRRRGAWGS